MYFNRGTENGTLIKKRRAEGKIIESDIMVKLIADRMEKCLDNGKKHFLIQGFPQNLENYEGWRRKLQNYVNVLGVLYISIDKDTLNKRIASKNDKEKKQYIATYDNFINKTMSIIQKFDSEGKLYKYVFFIFIFFKSL